VERRFDRSVEDLGNIGAFEHVNVTVPDQRLATLFYVDSLGLTRDPYLKTGLDNMWVNIGRNQFHLPTNKPQVVRGVIGIVVPDRTALVKRLERLHKSEGGRFDFREFDNYVDATCPWGNRIRCHFPESRNGGMTLGLKYLEFTVPIGTADGIARFYRQVMRTPASVSDDRGRHAHVPVGIGQYFNFRETADPIPEYDGHHVQVYVADFSGPYRELLGKGLISEESDQHQYRFEDLVDLETGAPLFTIEHEVRSMRHPMFMRPLVNRNPAQDNRNYQPGHDA